MDPSGFTTVAQSSEDGAAELNNRPELVTGSDVTNQVLDALNGAFDVGVSQSGTEQTVANSALGTSTQIQNAIQKAQSSNNRKKREGSEIVIDSLFLTAISETSPGGIGSFESGSLRKRALSISQCEREFWLEPGTTLEGNYNGPTGFVATRFQQDPFSIVAQEQANGKVGRHQVECDSGT